MRKPSAIARLEQKVKRLSTLIEVNALISSTLNLDQILENVMSISKQVMNADASSLMLIDEKTNELAVVAQEGMGPEAHDTIKTGEGVVGNVAKDGEAFYREGDPTDLAGVDYTHPLVCIPLKIKEHVIGAIVIYKLLIQKTQFSSMDYELFSMLAGHAATALFSSKLYSQSERKLSTIQSFLDLLKEKQ